MFFHEQLLYKYPYYVKGCLPFCRQNTTGNVLGANRAALLLHRARLLHQPLRAEVFRASHLLPHVKGREEMDTAYVPSDGQRKTTLQSKAPLTQDPNTQRTFYK